MTMILEIMETMETNSASQLFEHYKFIVDLNQTACRIDKFLFHRLSNVTRTKIQSGIQQQFVLVNGAAIKPSYQVKPKDIIQVVLPTPPHISEVVAENIALQIIYEDQALLILNKPAGMVVHPAHLNRSNTLVNALAYHFKNLPILPGNPGRLGLVHRMDKDTSGLMVVAKTEASMAHLAKQFYHHTIQRKYYALVWGDIKNDSGTIDTQLTRSTKDRRIVMATTKTNIGKRAITHYTVLKRFGYTTLVECLLETGRTHQIRAHMKFLGHPLFGDSRYGGREIVVGPKFAKYKAFIQNCFQLLANQALHAKALGFIHPMTQEKMYFDIDLPTNFIELLDKWTRYQGPNIAD